MNAYYLPSTILRAECVVMNKITFDFLKFRNKDCDLLEKPTATEQQIQAENRKSWMVLTCASQAKNMHVKHTACYKHVMKERRWRASQEVNSACNVTHATLLLGLHQLAQYF